MVFLQYVLDNFCYFLAFALQAQQNPKFSCFIKNKSVEKRLFLSNPKILARACLSIKRYFE